MTTVPPAPPPISPANYQAALTAVDTAVSPGFGQLARAQTPQQITDAVNAIGDALEGPIATLQNLRAPTAAAAYNDDLATGLQDLPDDLGSVSSAAGSSTVCLGSAAIALLSRADDLGQLRDTIAKLATADPANSYHVGAFLPAVTQDTNRFAPTGTIVAGRTYSGEGSLTITNGGDTDATLGIVPDNGNTPMVTVYVGHGATYRLNGIPDGVYQIYMTSGDDWDAGARLFARNCDFQRFDDTLDYTTTDFEATLYQITITPVVNGNASVSSVDPNAFPH